VIPTLIREVELSGPLVDLRTDTHQAARVLVRLHGTPVGFLELPVVDGLVSATDLAQAVEDQLDIAAHLDLDGIASPTAPRPAAGWTCQASGPFPAPGGVSVVLCTRDREQLLRTALASVITALGPEDEVVVVDNAPRTDATATVVRELADPRLRYVLQPRPGLSVARNTGARAARGELLAFTDDDVVVDAGWVVGLSRGFTRTAGVGCVTGLVPSAELDTDAQHFFDRKVAWSSSCTPRLFDLDGRRDEGVLYPYSAGIFGTGANFAISREAFDVLGGFDEALGAGALTRGGEDLDWFVRTLTHGFVLAYEPSAVVWHRHRRDLEALRDQLYGYGTGLTAYLAKQALTRRGAVDLSRRLVRGARLMGTAQRASAEAGIDTSLLRRELVGMTHGPFLYLRARWRVRRQARR
jgi:glycosyltransferase involved in cell wall biosynthesis